MQARERELPQPVRAERLLGPELEHELLELVEPVDARPSRPTARRPTCRRPSRPVPRADPREAAAGSRARAAARSCLPPRGRSRDRGRASHLLCWRGDGRQWSGATSCVEDDELLEDESLWRDDAADDHTGWWCVRTDPFPCPADGCTFVAEFMTAAHLVLVWQERDDPNLLWHAQRAKEVGRNPRVVSYERSYRPERVVLRLGGGRPPRARGEGQEARLFVTRRQP